MADENDEDIFADLYDGDDTVDVAPPTKTTPAPAPAVAPAPPALASESSQAGSAAPALNNTGTSQSQGDYAQGNSHEQATGPPQIQSPQPWMNNQAQGSWQGQAQKEPERPLIGTKEDGKMFIGGLNWETTDQSLRDYFSQFGEVVECTVMRDSASGRSRGFGFLTFRDPKCVNTVMVKEHHLDGKIIDPKRAIPRDEQERTSKIFVGGVSQEATEHDFKTYFQQFGRVLDATLMMDKDTGRPRGFGFVTFDSEAAVENTLSQPLEILGKPIEVKKAQPRGNMINDDSGGGRGRGRGGFNQGFGNQQNDSMGGGMMGGGMGGGQGPNQLTPNQAAQYWLKMQQYFTTMQQMMASGGGGGMNPAMQQQMMQMQAMNNGGGSGGMNPQMMQQMQQMQQENGGFNSPPAGSSWEGMYDDVPAPQGQQQQQNQGMPTGPSGRGRGGGFYRGGRGGGGFAPPTGPSGAPSAPANAPTGPKSMGRGGGGGYRGGGRGGHRGYHPYAR